MDIEDVKLVYKVETVLLDLSYINARDLLESTGISNISVSGGEITFSCPSPEHAHGDSTPSARMNLETTAFMCNGCSWRGNAIHFLSKYKSIPETVARRLLEERYGGSLLGVPIDDLVNEVKRIMKDDIKMEEKRVTPSAMWIDYFKVDWDSYGLHPAIDYMIDRGFSSDILNKWDIGYDRYSDRITIPIRDDYNNLIGFKGRTWKQNERIRYLILGDRKRNEMTRTLASCPRPIHYGFDPYKKSDFVFGLRNYIYSTYDLGEDENSHIIICEGELNVISMDQKGFFNAVSIAGSEFSDKQCDLIRTYASSATIFFDNDKAGKRGSKQVVEKLSPYISLKVVQDAPGDAAELSKEQIQGLLSGAESALLLEAKGEL
jgi:DNA primase